MTTTPFEYAVFRVVPRADREEFVNVGVALYCQDRASLRFGRHVDEARLRALHPDVDVATVHAALDVVEAVCAGTPDAGEAGQEPLGVRFRWLTAPRSTVVRPGPVHAGTTDDPEAQLARLVQRLVA